MPDIKFNCPKCNGEFTVDSSLVGRLENVLNVRPVLESPTQMFQLNNRQSFLVVQNHRQTSQLSHNLVTIRWVTRRQ